MMKALLKFEVNSGNKFSTYATWWIKQAISRFLKSNLRTIRIPIYKEEEILRIRRVHNQLVNKLMREPTVEELAKEAGYTIQKTRELLQEQEQTNPPISLSHGITESSDTEISSLIGVEDDSYEEIENTIYMEQFMQLLTRASLTQKEKEILSKRYGLEDGISHTLEEISKEYQLSKETIRKMELSALKKIRIAINFYKKVIQR